MLLLSAALLMVMQTMPEYATVEVKDGPNGCVYRTEGRRLNERQLEHRAQVWAGQRRIGEVYGNRNTPYQCVGKAMVIMQSAGMEKVSYVGKPIGPSVVVSVPATGCTPMINGDPVTTDELRVQSALWGRRKVQLHFEPDPAANFECVDSVLKILREHYPMNLGFVGSAQAPAR